MNEHAGNVASDIIGSQEVPPGGPLQYLAERHIGRRIANQGKLRPILVTKVLRRKFLERNVLKLRWPVGQPGPYHVVPENRKVDVILIPHDQGFVTREQIRQ